MEMAERGRVGSVAMEFPVSEGATSCSPPRMPPRLCRRLSESKTSSPSTIEEIEAKLRGADLRRQKFYENLSSKARPKPRSPSQSSLNEEDLGQRLEAKLQAAEQKRLSILAKAQMRLAKLDELRQAAKMGVEMRFRKERAELGTKMESRVQQAEANRMLLLKAYSQRRAMLKERTSQSLMRRMARESKYKERVRAAISQKRAAAEKKRLGLLEAEKRRAHAKVLQARKIAKSVSHQREIERKEMQNKLDGKLQRAKRQRAEYLMQRGKQRHLLGSNWNKTPYQADILSSKLARCWRQFRELKKTTLHLARAYYALNIKERSVKSMPFDQLERLILSNATLQTTKALLDRLESRYKLLRPASATSKSSNWDDIDHLLKRVASPKRRPTPRKSIQSREAKSPGSTREAAKTPVKLSTREAAKTPVKLSTREAAKTPVKLSTREASWPTSVKLARYQVRIVLCAYMILGHPDAVFSDQGDREIALAKSAEGFIREFELLVRVILDGPVRSCEKESDHESARHHTFRSQLAVFDSAWCSYLNSFVVWKVKDAQSLEEDLVGAACRLEVSMIQTCKMTPEGETVTLTHDMKAVQKQVTEDQNLLRETVHRLSGNAGIERMESALSDTRTKYFKAKENGSPVGSPLTHSLYPPNPDSPSASVGSSSKSDLVEDSHKSNHVKRSLFKDEVNLQDVGSSASSNRQSRFFGERVEMENELIVNEIIHGQHPFLDNLNVNDELHSTIKAKVRETMEKAFWDGIVESMKQDKPNYNRVVELMREVRDELSGIVPQSWKQEIIESIDLDILSQVLNSGKLDMDYLGKILNFALITLRKLSAPANEDDLKSTHMKFLDELAEICHGSEGSENSHVIALIRGLRFVLEQIQELKEEISRARIRMFEPFLRGAAAAEYLGKAFTHRYGPPSDALVALPLTKQWLSSVSDSKDQEWNEHKTAFTELTRRQESSSQAFLPSTTLRTGGSFAVKMSKDQATSSTGTTSVLPECKGEKVDLFVRLGLLKLVTGISGLTQEGLPETLKLNLLRLRAVQAHMQKIIVTATSVLVLHQTLISERMLTSSADMESIVSSSVKKLSELLDSAEDAGIKDIIETVSKVVENGNDSVDMTRLQSMKEVMARILFKSLQAGDTVFIRVSRAIYLAARAVVLGGTAANGRGLAETALRQVGAGVMVDEIVEAASALVVAATVSVNVHGPWYAVVVANM